MLDAILKLAVLKLSDGGVDRLLEHSLKMFDEFVDVAYLHVELCDLVVYNSYDLFDAWYINQLEKAVPLLLQRLLFRFKLRKLLLYGSCNGFQRVVNLYQTLHF